MSEYHKIHSVYKREPDGKRRLIEGEWSLPEFEYLKDLPWTWTEKVDGTNIRVMFNPYREAVSFAGKTDNASIPPKLLAHLSEQFTTEKMAGVFQSALHEENYAVTLYGEGYGAKIQKGGGNYRTDQGFILFDVRVGDLWLERHNVGDVAMNLGCPVVPQVGEGSLVDAIRFVRRGFSSCLTDLMPPEGLVMRPTVELRTRRGDRVIAKVKGLDFE